MKLDKRDIVAEPSYEPLSNAELVAHIETYAGLIYDMPLAERGRWQDEILGPARVLLERIEAAEALAYERLEAALFAEQRATDAELRAEEELEAQRERGDETNGFIDSLIAALDHPIRGDEVFLSEIVETATALKARVDELEAANTWRPVTADWPPRNQRVVISAPGASWADVARKQHDGEEYVWQLENGHALDFESATVATHLPPAPDTEPTL